MIVVKKVNDDHPIYFMSAKDYWIDDGLLNIRSTDGHLIATYKNWDSVAIIENKAELKAM